MVTVIVAVQGPPGPSEYAPCSELDVSAMATGAVAICGPPTLVTRARLVWPEGDPATSVCGGAANVSTGCDQARNAFHCSANDAPDRSPTQ